MQQNLRGELTPTRLKEDVAHRALLLVDLQNDFCAGGALAVPEGDSTVDVANALIDWARRAASHRRQPDWHPADHGVSPASTGGTHRGRAGRHGANFLAGSLRAAQRRRGAASAAQAAGDRRCVPQRANRIIDSSLTTVTGRKPNWTAGCVVGIVELTVLGLATDYCVKFTVLDARRWATRSTSSPTAVAA